MIAGASEELLTPPVNVLRLSLHPQGLGSRILNYREWRSHILSRLHQQIDGGADPALIDLCGELSSFPDPANSSDTVADLPPNGVVTPMQLRSDAGILSLFSTTTVFGTPVDVTLAELAIEAFFPADAETGERLRALSSIP